MRINKEYREMCAFDSPPTFLGAKTMFERLMDFPLFLSKYTLSAENREAGIIYVEDRARNYSDATARMSEPRKIRDNVPRILATLEAFGRDLRDATSGDMFVANSPLARAAAAELEFEDIQHEPADHILMYNLPEFVPLIGERLHLYIPFVPYRHRISVDREGELYRIEIITTTKQDLSGIVKRLPELKACLTSA